MAMAGGLYYGLGRWRSRYICIYYPGFPAGKTKKSQNKLPRIRRNLAKTAQLEDQKMKVDWVKIFNIVANLNVLPTVIGCVH
jgi:hypothetical protein